MREKEKKKGKESEKKERKKLKVHSIWFDTVNFEGLLNKCWSGFSFELDICLWESPLEASSISCLFSSEEKFCALQRNKSVNVVKRERICKRRNTRIEIMNKKVEHTIFCFCCCFCKGGRTFVLNILEKWNPSKIGNWNQQNEH
jgi:hypothetical protein